MSLLSVFQEDVLGKFFGSQEIFYIDVHTHCSTVGSICRRSNLQEAELTGCDSEILSMAASSSEQRSSDGVGHYA